jgi:hypothetical protein
MTTEPCSPDIVFIVPYRDRAPQKKVFECVMPTLLKDYNYRILFLHQKDTRAFNRGAMKNLGFIYVKRMWPATYKKITLVFHDIDFISYYKDQFNYTTTRGIVKHFFGYKWTLGGIVSMNAEDFERINGFPNIWTWGLEDNILQKRCIKAGYGVDRSKFLNGGHDENKLITLWHGWDRLINKKILPKFTTKSDYDGIARIKNIQYDVVNIKENVDIVNVTHFLTGEREQIAVRGAQQLNSRFNQNFAQQQQKIILNKQYRHHNIFPKLSS